MHGFDPVDSGKRKKPVLYAYFEPLPEYLWAKHAEKRIVDGKPQEAKVKISTTYRDDKVLTAIGKIAENTHAEIDGVKWDPTSEVESIVKGVPSVKLQLQPISVELLRRLQASGLVGRDELESLTALMTPAGHQAALSNTNLATYLTGAAVDLRSLGIPPGPEIDAAVPGRGIYSPERGIRPSGLV